MKTLTVNEAVEHGFKVFRYGFRRFLPVKLPREIAFADSEVIANQFEGADEKGNFGQAVEDTRGRLGVAGSIYICVGYYSEAGGIESWEYFGAVEVK